MTELWWQEPDSKEKNISIINGDTLDPNQPYEYVSKYKIKYAHSLVGGRGVFATEDIEKGELIERCPIVALKKRSKQQDDPLIWAYCYTKPLCSCEECKNNGFIFYMVLGHGMVYNHQDQNNADMNFDHKNLYVDIIANQDIKSGKEIFVTYGQKYFDNRPKTVVNN